MPHIKTLGTHLDSYFDLIPGGADELNKIRDGLLRHFGSRQFPGIKIKEDSISDDGEERSFTFVHHSSGAYLTFAFRKYGSDAFIKYDVWYKQYINWVVLIACLILIFAYGIGLFLLIVAYATGFLFKNKQLNFLSQEDLAALSMCLNHSLQSTIDDVGIAYKLREKTSYYSDTAMRSAAKTMLPRVI